MCNPYHQEWSERRALEQVDYLVEIECLCVHRRRLLRQVGNHSFLLVIGQKFGSLRITRQVEEGIYRAEDGRNALQDKELSLVITVSRSHHEHIRTQRHPARPPAPFMKLIAYARRPLTVPANMPQAYRKAIRSGS
jgi:hypothetical protein